MKLFGIVDDYRRYRAEGNSSLARVLLCQGFWAICEYRIAHAAFCLPNFMARNVLTKLCVLTQKVIQVVTGIQLPRTCRVGPALYIPHFGPVFIGEDVTIGSHCTIHPGTVIGSAGRGERRGCPALGDRVFVGVNAVLLGRITVGSDAAVGAGAVVTADVPPRSVVVGNPARVISTVGSRGLIAVSQVKEPA